MICSPYDPSDVRKLTIFASLLNILQFVTLSRINGLNINSIENLSGLKSFDVISLDATLASKLALVFWNLGFEEMLKEKEIFSLHQNCIKRRFNKKFAGKKEFSVGDLVLKWYNTHEDKGKHAKFQTLWIDPFQVKEKIG